MAAASPVPVLEMSQGGDLRVIAYLRELRQEIQNLQEGLEKLKTASGLTTEDAKSVLISACQESKARFERNRESIDTLQHSIRRVFQGDEALHARYGDAVAEIGNKWDAIVAHWSSGSDPAVAARIKEVDDEMDRIVYLCALLTVPERVNRNLETMQPCRKGSTGIWKQCEWARNSTSSRPFTRKSPKKRTRRNCSISSRSIRSLSMDWSTPKPDLSIAAAGGPGGQS